MLLRELRVLLALACLYSVQPAPIECPEDSSVTGYADITALNNDILAEETRIRNGATPNEPYTFVLCPQTVFDTSGETLLPLLNDARFLCGPDGSDDSCLFFGGTEQVRIEDSTVPGYAIESLLFQGIRFSAFESDSGAGASMNILSTRNLQVDIVDSRWVSFDQADFLIRQSVPEVPVVVNISNGQIAGGNSESVLFDSSGGTFNFMGLEVDNVDALHLVSTTNGGSSTLTDATITDSDMESITFTTGSSAQIVGGVTVTAMRGLNEAFSVSGAGSSLVMSDANVFSNQLDGSDWRIVTTRAGASTTITDSTFNNNQGVEFAVVAQNPGSTVSLTETSIVNNVAPSSGDNTSALIIAFQNAIVNMVRSDHENNADYTAEILAFTDSEINAERSCITDGTNMQFVVFIDRTSAFTELENHIGNQESTQCTGGPRLFKERESDACFIGGQCVGFCEVWATEAACRPPTEAPSAKPTEAPPSASPTMMPTVFVPTFSPAPTVQATTAAPSDIPICPDGSDPIKVFPGHGTKSAKHSSSRSASKSAKYSTKSGRRRLNGHIPNDPKIPEEYLRYGGILGRQSDQWLSEHGDWIWVCPNPSSKSGKGGKKKSSGGKKGSGGKKSGGGGKKSGGGSAKGSKSRRLQHVEQLRRAHSSRQSEYKV